MVERQTDRNAPVPDRDRQHAQAVFGDGTTEKSLERLRELELCMPTLMAISQIVPASATTRCRDPPSDRGPCCSDSRGPRRTKAVRERRGETSFHELFEVLQRRVEIIRHVQDGDLGRPGPARLAHGRALADEFCNSFLIADNHNFSAGSQSVDQFHQPRFGFFDGHLNHDFPLPFAGYTSLLLWSPRGRSKSELADAGHSRRMFSTAARRRIRIYFRHGRRFPRSCPLVSPHARSRVVLLLALEGLLILSERFEWFAFNRHKGWTMLIAVEAVALIMLLTAFWFLLSLIFKRRFSSASVRCCC